MAVNDNDLDLLHEYVDGELPVSECEGLWRRLAIERELASELEQLRAAHAVRTMVWKSLEPNEAAVVRLQASVMRASRRADIMGWASNALRIAASAAALILFGFSVGWLGRDRYTGVPVVQHPSMDQGHVATAGDGGVTPQIKYNVYVRDPSGKLLTIQQFDTEAEAQQFEHDLQSPQPQSTGDNNIQPSVNKF
jgi:hypothetical protein